MDNQQERELLLGWLAGIVDGEASIGLNAWKESRSKNRTFSLKPLVQITNTDRTIVDRAIYALKLFGIPHHVFHIRPRSVRNREAWRITIVGLKRFLRFWEIVGPHLSDSKREKAALVAEFCVSRLNDWKAAPFTPRQLEIYDLLAAANSRAGKVPRIPRDYTPDNRSSSHRFRSVEDIVQTTTA